MIRMDMRGGFYLPQKSKNANIKSSKHKTSKNKSFSDYLKEAQHTINKK